MHISAQKGKVDAVEYLLDRDVDLQATDNVRDGPVIYGTSST
jgi:hypothetical protein